MPTVREKLNGIATNTRVSITVTSPITFNGISEGSFAGIVSSELAASYTDIAQRHVSAYSSLPSGHGVADDYRTYEYALFVRNQVVVPVGLPFISDVSVISGVDFTIKANTTKSADQIRSILSAHGVAVIEIK